MQSMIWEPLFLYSFCTFQDIRINYTCSDKTYEKWCEFTRLHDHEMKKKVINVDGREMRKKSYNSFDSI